MTARRGARGAGILLVVALVLGIAVLGVVMLLRGLDVELPSVAQCTATDGAASAGLDPEQTANAALIAAIAVERGLPARAATIGIATAMQESGLENIDYGDRDSVGLFQQRPSQGWGTVEEIMDPVYATNAFYDVLVTVDGYEDMEITEAAQAVQRSAYPDAYAQHEPMARLFASALTGWSTASLTCQLPPGETGDAASAAASLALTELLARDLPSASTAVENGVTTLSVDIGDPTRSAWLLAHWAVATAELTGIQEVTIGDLTWSRSDGDDAGWVATDAPAPDGVVLTR